MKEINKKDIENRKKNLHTLKIGMIIIDVLTIGNLIFQLIIKDISYISLITVALCNVIVFGKNIKE